MSKFIKKFLSICLITILLVSSFSGVASAKTENEKNNISLTSKQKDLLKEANVDLSSIIVVNKNNIFNAETLKKMQQEDLLMEEKGYIKGSEVYYIKKSDITSTNMKSAAAGMYYDYTVYDQRMYTSYNDRSANHIGMANLLDTAFAIATAGSDSFIFTAAGILGISPSSFMTDYVVGDYLMETDTYLYNDTYYMWYDRNNNACPLVRTSRLNLLVELDLHTSTKGGQIVNKEGATNYLSASIHREDRAWINSECAVNQNWNGLACTYDAFR